MILDKIHYEPVQLLALTTLSIKVFRGACKNCAVSKLEIVFCFMPGFIVTSVLTKCWFVP